MRTGKASAVAALLVVVAMALAACSSDSEGGSSSKTTTTRKGGASATTTLVPRLPASTTNCGDVDLMAGWPTTTTVLAEKSSSYRCIANTLHSGTPARLVLRSAGEKDSDKKTESGDPIPVQRVTIWTVVRRGQLEVVRDRRAEGGKRTRVVCRDVELEGDNAPRLVGCTKP